MSWWQSKEDVWSDLFEVTNVDSSSGVIDVGGGASLLLDVLLDLGFSDLNLLDISAAAISRVKERLGNRISQNNFFVSDVLTFYPGRKFDAWHDRAVFHFLSSAESQSLYLKSVLDNLNNDGTLILSTFAPNGPETCSGLEVARHNTDSLLEIFGKDFDLTFSESRTHVTPWESKQEFTVAIFKRKQ